MNSGAFYQLLVIILGIAFLSMGIYSLKTGRTYGRTWNEYLGGWVYKNRNPVYYAQYTFMYFFVGAVLLVGCAVVGMVVN